MVQELNIYIDFHFEPFTIEVSDFETGIHAHYVCAKASDLLTDLPLALKYYKKLYYQYLTERKNGTKQQNNKTSKNVFSLDLSR